jgi:hypothetical protein
MKATYELNCEKAEKLSLTTLLADDKHVGVANSCLGQQVVFGNNINCFSNQIKSRESGRRESMSKRKNAKHPRHGDRHNVHRRPSGVRRAVEWRDGKRIEVVSRHKGYDVGMIRDFLDQLLLELRVQYYENLQVLKRLDSTDSLTEAANTPAVPTLVNQLQTYFGKYWSSLISVTAINEEGAPAEQVPEVIRALARAKSQTRDEQIGHLEALRDLFSCFASPRTGVFLC